MAHRYFAQQITDTTAVVTGDEARHLCRVMRIKAGDALILCDKSGFDYQCIAEEISETQITFSILSKQKNPAEPTKELVVYMALPKGDKLELIVQKSCELGATKLVPFVSEFCIAQKSKKEENKKQRLQKISDEACKQSGRSVPMEVADTLTFKQLLMDLQNQDTNLFFYENATTPFTHELLSTCQSVGIIIGSEGGFSEKECTALQQEKVHTISLGKRILRCETAAISAATLTMYLMNEME